MIKPASLRHSSLPNVTLSKHDVHIWRIFLDQPMIYVQQLASVLSTGEQTRARRFYFEKDRRRYIVCRGSLRCILSCYLNIEPDQVQFCYASHGKPALSELHCTDALCFNLSHAHELALYAITRNREVGVDLEYMHEMSGVEQLVERFFSDREIITFRALDPGERLEAFFKGWTRKEAYLKATGAGLSLPPDHIEVSLFPKKPARLLNVTGKVEEVRRWSLQDLVADPDYAAALVVEGEDYQLTYWQ